MIILKGLIAIVVFLIVPFLLGLLITRFTKNEKNNIILAYLIGYLIEFAICEIISIPLIFMQKEYNVLLITYVFIIGILSLISFVINFKSFKEIILDNIKKIKELPKLLSIICIGLILVQMFIYAFYTHIDDDDAFYVGTSVTTVQTNTLYKYSPTTGITSGENILLRYRLSPFPLYMAVLSSILNIHPTIVAHTIFPVIILPIIYSVYYLLSKEIFKEDKESSILFVILINLLNIFGGYSIRTNFAFLLFRIWQGKALLANLLIPSIWLFVLKAHKNNYKLLDCFILLILVFAANLTTTMAIGFAPISLMGLAFALELIDFNFKKFIKNILKCLVCCMPSIIYGLIYLLFN